MPLYQVAPLLLIRMSGAPFEEVERLGTPETIQTARIMATEKLGGDSKNRLLEIIEKEIGPARRALWQSARKFLASYLVFAPGGVRELLSHLLRSSADDSGTSRRNARSGDRERHLLLYLQRVVAKNDTFSKFGPTNWGKIDQQSGISSENSPKLKIEIRRDVARCEAFLERWTAAAIAMAMNADPDVRIELCPRLHPNCRIEGEQLIFSDTGETITLDRQTARIVKACDGSTPAAKAEIDFGELDALAKRKIILWGIEVPALDHYPLATILSDIKEWRDGAARSRWLQQLRPIIELPEKFSRETDTAARLKIMVEAEQRLNAISARPSASTRFLYAAKNPIGEECCRECNFLIDSKLIDEVVTAAEPWIDLWRDSYAFIANQVAAALRHVFAKAPARNGALALPAFLRLCEEARLPLMGPGLIVPAAIAFQKIKLAMRERLLPHVDRAEYELTAEDCHVVRGNFSYHQFDEYTYPSADLQLAAESVDAVERGDYQWILAEVHPAAALLQHCMYWACPDKPALHREIARTLLGRPNFYFGFSAADFTSHTSVHLFDALPDLTTFVAPSRGNPAWKTVPPSETEVFVDESNGDVCLRKIDPAAAGRYLGSFSRNWIIPLGFHPFQFGIGPHTPRLRCGKVVVQRRAWTIALDELGTGNFKGISRDLVLAVERLRTERDLPRFVYIRPTEQALRRSGAEGRDKDTKPVFIDLESYLFMEIFHRWLVKAGEIEVTEMLPDPDHLLWKEPNGRHTFELRTLIVPRRSA